MKKIYVLLLIVALFSMQFALAQSTSQDVLASSVILSSVDKTYRIAVTDDPVQKWLKVDRRININEDGNTRRIQPVSVSEEGLELFLSFEEYIQHFTVNDSKEFDRDGDGFLDTKITYNEYSYASARISIVALDKTQPVTKNESNSSTNNAVENETETTAKATTEMANETTIETTVETSQNSSEIQTEKNDTLVLESTQNNSNSTIQNKESKPLQSLWWILFLVLVVIGARYVSSKTKTCKR